MNPAVIQMSVWGLSLEVRLFGLISMALCYFLYGPYIKSMKMAPESDKPPRSSWFLWVALDIIIFINGLAQRKFDAMVLAYFVGSAIVAIFTIRYGRSGWTWIETITVIVVAASLAVWAVVGPSASTVCALLGVSVGLVPIWEHVLHGGYQSRTAWLVAPLTGVASALDGQLLTGIWFASLQVSVLMIIVYHWGWTRTPITKEASHA